MTQSFLSSSFTHAETLQEKFPLLQGTSVFDLHNKHLLYGRVDKDGDAIYLDDSNIKQLRGEGTHLAVDFVCEAFSDLADSIKSAADKGFVPKNSIYPNNLKAQKSWINGDLEFSYNRYLNKLYGTFVNSYLTVDGRKNRIKNYEDFVKEFLRFALRTIEDFPITKTGFITSTHCSPFITGLMLEVVSETHGAGLPGRVLNYIENHRSSFLFFANETKKYGFMVDKNAPWRIVFNIASGLGAPGAVNAAGQTDGTQTNSYSSTTADLPVGSLNVNDCPDVFCNPLGGQKYMSKYAVGYDNFFETYYRKAYLDEHLNLKNKLYSLYSTFYSQFGTYESRKLTLHKESGAVSRSCVVVDRRPREPPPTLESNEDEYWLRILLKLRMAETKTHHTPHNFNFYANKVSKLFRLFGLEASLKHINELTKGTHVINFLSKGSFFYGLPREVYEYKKLKAREAAANPSMVDYSLTGTKNVK